MMMDNQELKQTFGSAVYEYLVTICENNEKIIMESDIQHGFFLYAPNGIQKLGLNREIRIKPLYLYEPSEIVPYLNEFKHNVNVVLLVNIQKSRFCLDKQTRKINKNKKIIYAPDLEIDKKGYRSKEHALAINKIYKKKCLNIERLDEYLFFLIRLKILYKIQKEKELIPDKIFAKPGQNSVFPFIYFDTEETLFFYEDRRHIDNIFYKRLLKDESRIRYLKLKIGQIERELSVSISYANDRGEQVDRYLQRLFVEQVTDEDVYANIEVFNEIYGAYYLDEFMDLFKYRKFEKTRYKHDNETYSFSPTPNFSYPESKDIEIGVRSALENNVIWFSNRDSLNDPFDLLGRLPFRYSVSMSEYYKVIEATDYKTTNTKFLTFCSTATEDNILMWSHYGDCHKGTCMRYPMLEIIRAIQKDDDISICFYGKIKYKKNRTTFGFPFSTFRFLDLDLAVLRFNIICMFEKYKDWKYENEYRFLIIPKDYPVHTEGFGTKLKGSSIYLGNCFPDKYLRYISNFYRTSKQFKLSDKEYKLI